MRWATGVAGDIERDVLARSGVDEASFRSAGLKGSRRAGRIAVDDLEIDALRLQEIVVPHMKKRFKYPPPKWYTMLLCETWWEKQARWWTGAIDSGSAWTRREILDKYERGAIHLRDDISFAEIGGRKRPWPVYWLYGYREYTAVEGLLPGTTRVST
jgi:hypothetical protein